MLKIILIEDHPLVRETLRQVLDIQLDFCVIGEAADGLIGMAQVNELRPDVVIVDFRLPGLDGVQIARRIRGSCPGCTIIMFSIYDDPAYIAYALASGVTRYISKTAPVADLIQAIRVGNQHKTYRAPL
jgi:DNA-binding NarL/FixJ family response regulator